VNFPSAISPDRLSAQPLSTVEWRISGPRERDEAPLRLRGFVRQIGELFETTRIGHPLERRYFASLAEAIGDFASRGDRGW
jgi:hypothetical protein